MTCQDWKVSRVATSNKVSSFTSCFFHTLTYGCFTLFVAFFLCFEWEASRVSEGGPPLNQNEGCVFTSKVGSAFWCGVDLDESLWFLVAHDPHGQPQACHEPEVEQLRDAS